MGTFRIRVQVGNLSGGQWRTFNAMVDTGSTYSSFPRNRLTELRIFPTERRDGMEIAQGQRVSYEIGFAMLRLQEREVIIPVVFEEPDATPVIGATALENFGLAVDPTTGRLVPGEVFG